METTNKPQTLPSLAEVIRAGGVQHDIRGVSKGTVLRAALDTLRLPAEIDTGFLLNVLLAREELASTAVGDGIAIPHVRNPMAVTLTYSMVALCFLEHPVDFGALDGVPVYCLFLVISPDVRTHLHLLSRIALVLRDEQFKALLARRATRDEVLQRIEQLERGIPVK
ncbi:MAG: PTS sugar transporter subunit IIA [bacterium]|nr:PTS sugar transporter subunit IIA [bacterium]